MCSSDLLAFRAAGLAIAFGSPAGNARDVTLGVRPEHVRVTSGDEGWPATVNLVEPLGDETLVFLDHGGPASLIAKMHADEPIAAGDRRRFTFNPDKLLCFDGGTGERIRP